MTQQKKSQHNPFANSHTTFESVRHSDNKAERIIINFTRIPEWLIATALSSVVEGSASPKNHTDLNDPDVRTRMEKQFESKDGTESKIADVRRQLDQLRHEERDARDYFEKKSHERSKHEEEYEKTKAQEEQRRNQAQMNNAEPSTKQKRGQLFGKKRKKTIETNAAFGKQ